MQNNSSRPGPGPQCEHELKAGPAAPRGDVALSSLKPEVSLLRVEFSTIFRTYRVHTVCMHTEVCPQLTCLLKLPAPAPSPPGESFLR